MKIIKENCSLILERDSLVENGELYEGTFVPVDPTGVYWTSPLIDFLNRNKNIPVEFGPTDPKEAMADFNNFIYTRSKYVGLLIMAPMTIDEDNLRFKFSMLPHGPFKEEIIQRLNSQEPFIIYAKTLIGYYPMGDHIRAIVTQITGLETLPQEELEMPLPANNETLNPSQTEVIQINQASHINDTISGGNVDMEAVMKLNLAAGNFINHKDAVPASHYESQIKRQMGIDLNECFELLEAYITGDTSLLRDALADKRITLNGFQTILPFSLIADYRGAVDNNFTRFDTTYERALETQEKYAAIKVTTVISLVELDGPDGKATEYFVNKVAEDVTATTGEVFTKGKWVKSKYFKNDAFEPVAGLFTGEEDVHAKVQALTARYLETHKLLRKLTRGLGKAYTDAVTRVCNDADAEDVTAQL